MKFALNLPINGVSFGQVSIMLLKEIYKRGLKPCIFPIGNQADLSSQDVDEGFVAWLNECVSKAPAEHKRSVPIFKIWHLFDSLNSLSNTQFLLSFYELDSPTTLELNFAKNNEKTIFSSEYTKSVFESFGVSNCEFLPLAFDSDCFSANNKTYFPDRITFNLVGKFEKRKHHVKAIREWLNLFGNNGKYNLQCSVHNPFLNEEQNKQIQNQIVNGQRFGNLMFLNFMPKNSTYNDYLNSADVVIGCSGGEGWGLPEFQSVAIGKHAVILNANGYKSWATKDNCILFEPNGKTPVYDNMFFKEGGPYNQGNIFDFDASDYKSALERSVEAVKKNRKNENGLLLQKKFTASAFCDKVLSLF